MMILAMEIAAGDAVKAHLPAGWATVGSEVNIRHLAPTPMGRTVVATARVVEVSGRSLLFAVEAHDGTRLIGDGTHRRGVVNLESFAKRFGASCVRDRQRTQRRSLSRLARTPADLL
jgi:fluoroacetyl-CoA thioesterase